MVVVTDRSLVVTMGITIMTLAVWCGGGDHSNDNSGGYSGGAMVMVVIAGDGCYLIIVVTVGSGNGSDGTVKD